jgi:hypothetical protein
MKQILFILLCLPLLVMGQDAASDIQKINAFYLSHDFSCAIDCKVYDSWNGQTLIDEKEGESKKSGDYKYYKMGTIETYSSPDAYMSVDHQRKSIFISSLKKGDQTKDEDLVAGISVMLKACKKVEYTDEGKALASYTLMYPSREVEKVKIVFDKRKFCIIKIVMYSKVVDQKDVYEGKLNKPRIEMSFSKVNNTTKFKPEDFSFTKYLEKQDGKWILKKSYSSYHLLNQLK